MDAVPGVYAVITEKAKPSLSLLLSSTFAKQTRSMLSIRCPTDSGSRSWHSSTPANSANSGPRRVSVAEAGGGLIREPGHPPRAA